MLGYVIATLALVVSSQLVIAQQAPLEQVQEAWQNWKIEDAPERIHSEESVGSEVESLEVSEPVNIESVESVKPVELPDPFRPVVQPMVRYDYERAIIQPHYNQLKHDYQGSFRPVQLQEPVRAQSQQFPVFQQVQQPQEYQPFKPVQKPIVREEPAVTSQEQPRFPLYSTVQQAINPPKKPQETITLYQQYMPAQRPEQQQFQPYMPVQQPIVREEPAWKPQEQQQHQPFPAVRLPEQQPYVPIVPIQKPEQQQVQHFIQPEQQQFQPYRPVQKPEQQQYQTYQQPEQQQFQPYVQQPTVREEPAWWPQEPTVQQYQPYGQQFQPYGQVDREEQPWMQQQPSRTENQAPTWSQPEPQLSYQSWQQNAYQQPGTNAEQQTPSKPAPVPQQRPEKPAQIPQQPPMYNAAPVQNVPQRLQVQPLPQPNWPAEVPSGLQFERPIHQQPQPYQQPQQQYQQPQRPQYQQHSGEETYVVVPGVVDVRCPRNDDPKNPMHFPVRGNCQKFLKCYGGRAYEMDCPRGLDFNAQSNRCEYPEDARCSGY